MSAAFARGSSKILNIYVRTRVGRVQRSTGTTNKVLARKMVAMCKVLRDDRDWPLLDAIRDNRLSLPTVYDHYSSNALDRLRAVLADADVVPHLDAWEAAVKATRGDTGTAETYRWQVERFTGSKMLASDIAPARVSAWLAGLGVTPGTARKNLYALSSFVRYLRSVGVLSSNPLDLVLVPKKNPPRLRYESLDVCKAIVQAQEEPYRTISAFLHATGAEIGAVLRMVPRDLDLERMRAHIPGSKAITRNRYDVVIEEWAKPYLEAHMAVHAVITAPGVEPIDYATTPIFSTVTRYKAYWFHKQACAALKIHDLTVHDARHSLAVRWRKQGIPLEVIAAQLGHRTVLQVAQIYGRFQPTLDERHAELKT